MNTCAPGNLASTLCCCLCCYFLVYKQSMIAMSYLPTKPPHLMLLVLCACCSMLSQTVTMGSCAYNAIVPENKENN